jgi:hypothetical protein
MSRASLRFMPSRLIKNGVCEPGERASSCVEDCGGGCEGSNVGGRMRQLTPPATRSDLGRDVCGVIYVEYLILLCLVTLIGAGAVAALGLPLLRLFRYAEMLLLLPVP